VAAEVVVVAAIVFAVDLAVVEVVILLILLILLILFRVPLITRGGSISSLFHTFAFLRGVRGALVVGSEVGFGLHRGVEELDVLDMGLCLEDKDEAEATRRFLACAAELALVAAEIMILELIGVEEVGRTLTLT
jgi:hypothetical protein